MLESFILNQQLPVKPADETIYASETVYIPVLPDPPSRFRRKKGYTGPTAQPFNRNYKAMPKDF